MLSSTNGKWKQPVLYQFVQSAAQAAQIMKTIKDIVKAAASSGLNVIATVCDQGTNNTSAINKLIEDTVVLRGWQFKTDCFEVDGKRIIPFYDPPHLLKGIRNNLLAGNIHFKTEEHEKVAMWEDIYKTWLLDSCSEEVRLLPKIGTFHVEPEKIKKMKVSICAQVFSRTMAAAINMMALTGKLYNISVIVACIFNLILGFKRDSIQLQSRSVDTSQFVLFMDKVFDSVNGSSKFNKSGKILRTSESVLENETEKTKFWQYAIKVFRTMYLSKNGNGTVPPTFKNWPKTLENLLVLRKALKSLGVKQLNPRKINQDSIENFLERCVSEGNDLLIC